VLSEAWTSRNELDSYLKENLLTMGVLCRHGCGLSSLPLFCVVACYLDRNVFWCVDWILQCCQVQFFAYYYRGLLPCAERCTHGESFVLSTQEFINNTIEERAAARISENETTIF
jgi:hypothetical protein